MAIADIKQAISDKLHGIHRVSRENHLVNSFFYGYDDQDEEGKREFERKLSGEKEVVLVPYEHSNGITIYRFEEK